MKKLIFFISCIITKFILFADTLPQYELNFIKNEKEIIKNQNLISKQQVINAEYETLLRRYTDMDKNELKKMLDSDDIILVEDVTLEENRKMYFLQYFYSIQVKSKDGRILTIISIDARTGESAGGIMMDVKDRRDFIIILNRTEIIDYIKKHFTFPETSKLTIRAVYDNSFYYGEPSATYSGYWKYCVTIENGTFNSPALPAGVTTVFITPFVRGYDGKREEAAPDNEIVPSHKHRLYTYNYANDSGNLTESRVLKPESSQNKYIGID